VQPPKCPYSPYVAPYSAVGTQGALGGSVVFCVPQGGTAHWMPIITSCRSRASAVIVQHPIFPSYRMLWSATMFGTQKSVRNHGTVQQSTAQWMPIIPSCTTHTHRYGLQPPHYHLMHNATRCNHVTHSCTLHAHSDSLPGHTVFAHSSTP